ncbi:MAG: glycosyltransferase family 2 protein [Acidobacteriota bacterium]
MDLSVVVVNWNSGNHLVRLLASLAPLSNELKEVWVVDNGSTDSSLEDIRDYPGVRVLALEENRGFAGGANEGVSRTSSNFILLLNPDVEVISDSLRQLYGEMQKRPRAAIICGSLRDGTGRPQHLFQLRLFPTWKSVLSDALFIDELTRWVRGGLEKPCSSVQAHSDVLSDAGHRQLKAEQPAAAFWLLRKKAWEELEGFDARFYPAWFEDVDFCKRLRATPWQIFYFPNLPVIHRGGLALDTLSYPVFVSIFYRNLLKYLKKHYPYSYPLLWFPVQCGMWIRRLFIRR